MPEQTFETVMVDRDTKAKLKKLAKANERSMAAQIRWWVLSEYNKIATSGVAEPVTSENTPTAQ